MSDAQRRAEQYAERMADAACQEFATTGKPVANYRAGEKAVAAWGADEKGAWHFAYEAPFVQSDFDELLRCSSVVLPE